MDRETSWICPDVGVNGRSSVDFVMLKAAASIDTRCGQAFSQAAKRAASIFKMMDVSRHRSVDTLRGYVRDAELFQDHARRGIAVTRAYRLVVMP